MIRIEVDFQSFASLFRASSTSGKPGIGVHPLL